MEEEHAGSTAVHALASAHKVCSQSSVRESSELLGAGVYELPGTGTGTGTRVRIISITSWYGYKL